MKDLGELLKINVDSNQKHVKDHTKPMETYGGKSPKKVSKKKSERFKKIKKKLNVEKIPGHN